MAVKGKGKQIAADPVNSSGKRKSVAEEVDGSASGGKRKKRTGVLQFFDDAAVDADLDDEEEDESDGYDMDLVDEDIELDFSSEKSKQGKGFGKGNPLPFFVKEEELSGDELENLIRNRYGRGSGYVVYDEEREYDDDDDIAAEAGEQSLKDATIWRVKCTFGRERQITFSLMQKYVDVQDFKTKLGIISVFALEHIKGYVFIEADKATDVVEACRGMCNIYVTRINLVPKNEIPHLLHVRNRVCEVSKGAWVRMKNGKYKGDLGQVVAVDEARKKATIKMIPRIDLEAIAKKYGGGVSLKHSATPAQRLISSHELGYFKPHVEIKRDRETGEVFEVLDGLMFKDGYLYKKIAISSLVHWGVQPTEKELLKFTDSSKPEDADLDWLSSVYEERKRMKPAEASSSYGATKDGSGYDLHELVLFGRKGFGVIISLGKDGIQILKGDAEGQTVVSVQAHDIKKGCDDKMFTAQDLNKKTIYINDLVKVAEGPIEGRQGIVRHMYRGTLFLYDENQEENSGIFCAKSSSCESIRQSRGPFGKSGKHSSSSFSQPSMTSCDEEDNPRTYGRFSQREPAEQTFSVGQTLRIKKGPLKGYLCRVVGVYRKRVTVKLDSLVKTITVEEEFLSVPNVRSDGSGAVPLGDEGRDNLGQSSWNTGRDSWQALTSTFTSNNDQKSDQGQGDADPWGGSKLNPVAEGETADPWGASLASGGQASGDPDPWGGSKLTNVAQADSADPWGSKATARAESADPWGSKAPTRDQEQGAADPWGNKEPVVSQDQGQGNAADPWGSKMATVAEVNSYCFVQGNQSESVDPWGSKVSLAPTDKGKGVADPWGSKVSDKEQGAADPWGSKTPVTATVQGNQSESADPWGSKASLAPTDKGKGVADPWSSKVSDKEQGAADPWGSKAPVTSADPAQGNAWGSKASLGDSSDKASDNWGKTGGAEQNSTWNNVSTGVKPQDISSETDATGWNKPSDKGTSAADRGNTKQSGTGDADNWGAKSTVNSAESGSAWGSASSQPRPEADAWDVKGNGVVNDSAAWDQPPKAQENSSNKMGGWDAAVASVPKSSDTSKTDPWGKGASDTTASEGWNKPMNHEGGGGSWESGGNRNDGAGGGQDQENSWGNQRDSQGGRSFGRGRGRGRYGDSGNRDGSGGDWGSGRGGRGRGRNGDGGSFSNNFDGSGSSGRGRGGGRGRGRFESSDWKNNQDSFGDGSFSNKSASGWGNDEQGGWAGGKSASQGQSSDWNTPKPVGDDQNSSWSQATKTPEKQSSDWASNEGKSWDTPKTPATGTQSSGWEAKTTGNNAGGASDAGGGWDKPKPNANQSSDWSSSGKKEWGAEKSAGGDQPSLLGKPPSGTSNWSNAGASGGNSSGWNVGKAGGNDDGNSWNKPSSFGGNQSSGERSGGWGGRGRNDQSFGGRGGNSFSGRSRGRGRNSDGGRWGGGRGGNQEGSFGSGNQSSWNSESGKQSGGWGEQSAGGISSKSGGGGGWGEPSAAGGSGKSGGGGGWGEPSAPDVSGKSGGGWGETSAADGSGKSGSGGGWGEPSAAGGNGKSGGGGGWDQPKNSTNSGGGTSGGWDSSNKNASSGGGW